jgi:hypothetical protein
MHAVGRRATPTCADDAALKCIVRLFHDTPSLPTSPFSVHAICEAGAKYGLVAGRWMGPYALCRALEDLAQAQRAPLFRIVTVDSGGGAPCIDPELCASPLSLVSQARHLVSYAPLDTAMGHRTALSRVDRLGIVVTIAAASQLDCSSTLRCANGAVCVTPHACMMLSTATIARCCCSFASHFAQHRCNGSRNSSKMGCPREEEEEEEGVGILLLLPVVLGVERLNTMYAEQLKQVLTWPQSVGIVGGKPGHSYYFLGFQVCPLGLLGLISHCIWRARIGPASWPSTGSHLCPVSCGPQLLLLNKCCSCCPTSVLFSNCRCLCCTHWCCATAALLSTGIAIPHQPTQLNRLLLICSTHTHIIWRQVLCSLVVSWASFAACLLL